MRTEEEWQRMRGVGGGLKCIILTGRGGRFVDRAKIEVSIHQQEVEPVEEINIHPQLMAIAKPWAWRGPRYPVHRHTNMKIKNSYI